MTSTSDGWPQFIKTIDQRRQRKATQADGGLPGTGTGARPGGNGTDPETPAAPHRATDAAWAIAGGTAVFTGSLLPFISVTAPGIGVNPGARAASALFGLILLGIGITLRAVQPRYLMGTSASAVLAHRYLRHAGSRAARAPTGVSMRATAAAQAAAMQLRRTTTGQRSFGESHSRGRNLNLLSYIGGFVYCVR